MFHIRSYDHIGVRVTDRERAAAFYARLGFRPEPNEDSPHYSALGLINDAGVRINLVYNGTPHPERNVLMDTSAKWPGYTHYAVLVDSLEAVLDWAEREGIAITEGPVVIGDRRTVAFIRDPDGNVIEFDELLPEAGA
ncbi:MAG TPA: VOC family protein [Allosphingosinicella sp.]|jgi:catechol 2,3-dioxygenase-like lactoylglutathione lyase family enzyme|uniref:VOC family protein n=1 Tax=Allosphingosinicella sp. TaxID=2823234 RepID=UPI002F2A9257